MKKVKFDLEKAKADAKLVTRDGRPARIVCWDRKRIGTNENFPILALVEEIGEEYSTAYTSDGKHLEGGCPSEDDLFILEENTYRPYANAEEVLKDMKEHGPMIREKDEEHYCSIVHINKRGIQIDSEYCYTFEQLKQLYTWQDGHPCGVEEGDEE